MPIILSEKDLVPLLANPSHMDDLLALIEESLQAYNRSEVAGQVRLETSLLDAKKKYRITTSAVPGAGQGMRVSALFRGAKDAYFIFLFDGERGDLLAVVAGRSLNVWRTGAPARRGLPLPRAEGRRRAWPDRQRTAGARAVDRHPARAAAFKKRQSV